MSPTRVYSLAADPLGWRANVRRKKGRKPAMAKTLRLGQLGAGFIGQMHSLAFGEVHRLRREPVVKAELVALTDRDRALTETVAARYGWAAIADSWQDIVARPDIDLFLNSGPNNLHREPCVAPAHAGKHVFV